MRLASLGYHVILLGRNAAKLEATAKSIGDRNGSAEIFQADVRDWQGLAQLQALLEPSGLDILINSAGGQFAAPAAELSQNGWKAVLETNLSGSFFLCRHLYAALRKRRGSAVMVVANLWQRPAPKLAHACAARAGVVNLTRALALEWAADGIRVNAVSPGLTDTEALLDSYKSLIDKVPLGRMGSVDEVVDAILFMAQSSYITGEVLTVDGGLHLT